MIRQLKYFTFQLCKETILQLFLLADAIGLILIYWQGINIPSWLLALLTIFGVYLASFKLYKRGTADVRLMLSEISEVKFNFIGGDLNQGFNAKLAGNLANFGPQTGVLEDFSTEVVSLNDITDVFILNQLNIGVWLSPLLPKKDYFDWHPSSSRFNKVELPFVLPPGQVMPICIAIHLQIESYKQEAIEETARWLESIRIRMKYIVTQSSGRSKEQQEISVPTSSLGNAISEGKRMREQLAKQFAKNRDDNP